MNIESDWTCPPEWSDNQGILTCPKCGAQGDHISNPIAWSCFMPNGEDAVMEDLGMRCIRCGHRSKPELLPRCETCRFFYRYSPEIADDRGWCRRHAPTGSESAFPIVLNGEWCGDYEKHDVDIPKSGYRGEAET